MKDIKSQLPPNIKVGGDIYNTGDMEINDKKMPQTPADITPEAAKKAIEAEQKSRVDACVAELSNLLKKYNCTLDIAILVTAKGNIPQLNILPL